MHLREAANVLHTIVAECSEAPIIGAYVTDVMTALQSLSDVTDYRLEAVAGRVVGLRVQLQLLIDLNAIMQFYCYILFALVHESFDV